MKVFQIEIPKRSSTCFLDQEKFVPKMEYYSLLLEDEQLKIQRQDFCKSCWETTMTEKKLAHSKGYWKSKIDEKEIKTPSNKAEKAFQLLKNLMQNDDANQAEIYVLAILLAHFRRLILRKEFEEDGNSFHLYEIARQDEFIKVRVVQLPPQEIESIQKSLANKFKS